MDTPFAAVLLAGGRSRRMGSDKALLTLPDGRRLWERQLDVLRELGPAELFISGPARAGFCDDVQLLADETPNLGPLSGIAVALRTMQSLRLVVLAVDMPAMTAGFLRGLLTGSTAAGVVPRASDGYFEPLAAVYPHTALARAEACLRGEDRSLQAFVRWLVKDDLATPRPVAGAEANLFANWNRPDDLPSA